MPLARFGVSLEKYLLKRFDDYCGAKRYSNRSEAIRDLIRDALVKEEWSRRKGDVTGVISLVYNHHKRELANRLIDIQHQHQHMITASQHIHLDHDNCLEVIIVKGPAISIKDLASFLRSESGVKHSGLMMTTTGKSLK